MKYLPLVWAMLWRSKARTWLTFLTIVVAFVLFALLRTLESGFFQGVRIAGDNRLVVTYRQGLTNVLPYAQRAEIEKVPGVVSVQAVMPFGGTYQDPKNQIPGVAVDMDERIVADARIAIAPEALAAWRRTRAGVLVGRDLAEQYGWKVGDRIPLTIETHRRDGTQLWDFEVVGHWEYDEKVVGQRISANMLIARYDFWNEAVQYQNYVLWYTVTIADPARAMAVGRAIDALFLNSRHATKSQMESEFQAGFLRQIGNIGAVLAAILVAVFFTLTLVAGNTMMEAFRERVPELGVLKTLGFGNRLVAGLLTAEALVLCLAAGGAGLGLSAFAVRILEGVSLQGLPMPGLETATVVDGLMLALGLGLLAAVIPAWRSMRLSVVDALAVA